MRGLWWGLVMLVGVAAFTWMLGSALEMRAEAHHPFDESDTATGASKDNHWMF